MEKCLACGQAINKKKVVVVKVKSVGTPFWAELLAHIKSRWEYKKPNGKFQPAAKDLALLKAKARVYDAFELMALYEEFMRSDDPFYAKGGHAIWVFCGAIDALVDRPGWKEKANKYRFASAWDKATLKMVQDAAVSAIKSPNHVQDIQKLALRKEGIVQP